MGVGGPTASTGRRGPSPALDFTPASPIGLTAFTRLSQSPPRSPVGGNGPPDLAVSDPTRPDPTADSVAGRAASCSASSDSPSERLASRRPAPWADAPLDRRTGIGVGRVLQALDAQGQSGSVPAGEVWDRMFGPAVDAIDSGVDERRDELLTP